MIEEIIRENVLTKGKENQIEIQLQISANRPSKHWNEG